MRILAVSPELSLFAQITYGSRWRAWLKYQTCSASGLLRMRVWRLSLRRAISAIISWIGSNNNKKKRIILFPFLPQCLCCLWYVNTLPWGNTSYMSRLIRLWHLSPSVNQSSNTHAQQSTGATRLIFGQTLRLLPYFRCANSEGSGESV